MKVHVLGPNLLGSDIPDTFHIHAEGCADVLRSKVYRGAEMAHDRENAEEFESVLEIAEYVYDYEDNPAEYVNDFRVFPCAEGLS